MLQPSTLGEENIARLLMATDGEYLEASGFFPNSNRAQALLARLDNAERKAHLDDLEDLVTRRHLIHDFRKKINKRLQELGLEISVTNGNLWQLTSTQVQIVPQLTPALVDLHDALRTLTPTKKSPGRKVLHKVHEKYQGIALTNLGFTEEEEADEALELANEILETRGAIRIQLRNGILLVCVDKEIIQVPKIPEIVDKRSFKSQEKTALSEESAEHLATAARPEPLIDADPATAFRLATSQEIATLLEVRQEGSGPYNLLTEFQEQRSRATLCENGRVVKEFKNRVLRPAGLKIEKDGEEHSLVHRQIKKSKKPSKKVQKIHSICREILGTLDKDEAEIMKQIIGEFSGVPFDQVFFRINLTESPIEFFRKIDQINRKHLRFLGIKIHIRNNIVLIGAANDEISIVQPPQKTHEELLEARLEAAITRGTHYAQAYLETTKRAGALEVENEELKRKVRGLEKEVKHLKKAQKSGKKKKSD